MVGYASLEAALAAPCVDAVLLALPREATCAAVVAALEAGKRVFSARTTGAVAYCAQRCVDTKRVLLRSLARSQEKPGCWDESAALRCAKGRARMTHERCERRTQSAGWEAHRASGGGSWRVLENWASAPALEFSPP